MPNIVPLLALSDDVVRLAYQTHEWTGWDYNRQRFRRPESDEYDWDELRWAQGALTNLTPASFSVKHRPRGEFISRTIGTTTSLCIMLQAPFAMAPLLRMGIPMLGITGSKAVSMFATLYPAIGLGNFATRAVRYMANYGYHMRRIEMGGDYEDSATAAALRFAALRDMSAAHGIARSYLGREALYLNR
jgi:hypothetical protein